MKFNYTAAVIVIIAVASMAGCDKKSVQNFGAKAEIQVEKAGAVMDDASITARIKTALIAEPGLKGLSIDVDTSQNVVSLSGTVGTDAAGTQAADIARRTEGVKDVKNNLVVKPPA